MTLRRFSGVVPAVLFVLGGAFDSMASEPASLAGGNECCVVVQGKCVPCESTASITPTAHFASSTTAARTVSASLASAGCDGPCVPMTPAECAASGCEPASCTGGPCAPVSSCGSGSGCNPTATSALVGIRDARTGEVTFVTMPLAEFKAMLAANEKPPVGGDI